MDRVSMKVGEVVVASQSLAELLKVKRPVLGALKLRQVARSLAPHLEDYNAEREKLLTEYAAKDEGGNVKQTGNNVIFLSPEARQAFVKAMNDLLGATVEVGPVLRLKDLGGLDVEGEHLVNLGALLDEAE